MPRTAQANSQAPDSSKTKNKPQVSQTSDPGPMALPSRFKANGGNDGVYHESSPGPVQGPWWSLFHDATLEKLEREALVRNQDLRQSVARVLEAREQARAVAADFFPSVIAPLSATRQRTTNTGPISRSRIIGDAFPSPGGAGAGPGMPDTFNGQALTSTFNNFQAQLALGYEVDVFGRIRHAYGQARANAQASEADRQAVELSLTSQVAASYFTLRALDSQVAVLRDTLHLRADAVKIQKERLKAGFAGDADLYLAQSEEANTEADLAEALQRRTELENALAVLCGRFASDFHLAESPLGRTLPPPIPPTLPAQLLTQRPDIVEAGRRLAAGSEGIKSARAEFFPTVRIGAGYGYESAESSQFFKDQSHTWLITGAISIPLFEGGRNKARLNAARSRYDEAVAAYRQTALTAFKEAENALSALQRRATQADARERATESARRVFDIAQKSYREGAINYFDVIDAQRTLLNAELSQVNTLNARYGATIDLIRAIGGGYEPCKMELPPRPAARSRH